MDKENLHSFSSPLRQKHYNLKSMGFRQDFKQHKHDHILMAIQDEINNNTSCDLIDVILTDPLLKELNTSLQKEAEQQKKNKLLQSFPQRYKNLVHTQTLYKKLQENLKEVEKETQEVKELQQTEKEMLMSQIQYYKNSVQVKNEQLQTLKNEYENDKKIQAQSFKATLEQKDKQIAVKIDEIYEMQRKMTKVKCQKQNLIEYLQQLKEEGQNLKKQNERIIKVVTNHEFQINRLNQILNQNEDLYSSSKKKFIQEFTLIQLQCKEKIDIKNNESNSLIIENKNLINRVKQIQVQFVLLRDQKQKEQTQKTNQIQDLKQKLVQSDQLKNGLEGILKQVRQNDSISIKSLQLNIAQLSAQIVNKNIEMEEKNLQYELELHKIRQSIKKIEEGKDETIDQIKQNVNLLTEQKLFIQGRVLKLQTEKQTLLNQIERMKTQIESQQKKIMQMSIEQKINDNKQIQIQKIAIQFKDQLSKFMEIIKQKEQKIQEYRKNIMHLRAKINEAISDKQSMAQELQVYANNNSMLINQVDRLRTQLSKCNTKQNVLSAQIQGFSKIVNKRKEEKSTQVQIMEGVNDEEQKKLQYLNKKLEKTQQKYENILEELQQYKKQYKEQIAEKQNIINNLKNDNKNMKDMIGNKIGESVDISKLLSTKIQQLKSFYERKMVEQDKKYRTTIDVLKTEVIELYKQIDLKKSMEEEMFNEIMKINKERKANREEFQL